MSFSSLKNMTPSTFYFASVICFVLASVLKDKNISIYYILLVLGIGLFFVGAIKRSRTKR
ncbi:hypothetical protein ACFSJW_20790 [Flavobacterium artemisiae]|jgi:hypothetical protein|uniref:LPXTG-motif cell wall anchor domain-containing protein n=1 Tax=Flavobacterium artemisiae TaxID=2126556 RepID=A0ABW4HBP5_9FLAO